VVVVPANATDSNLSKAASQESFQQEVEQQPEQPPPTPIGNTFATNPIGQYAGAVGGTLVKDLFRDVKSYAT